MRFLFLTTLLCVAIPVLSQDFNNYTPLRSRGMIPAILTKPYPEAVNEELTQLDEGDFYYLQKKQFIIYTRLIMSRLLTNGQLLINDSLGAYVNQVADQLLADDPELRKRINVFVVKSPVVNAYTLDNGIILVNAGLLAQLQNEAELAYILAHEITHFTEHHSMQEFVNSFEGLQEGISREKYFLDKLSFSRENELFADARGLERLFKTNYDTKASVSALDVLKYSYLPFDEVTFENSFLESDDLKLPSELTIKEIQSISDDEDQDDTHSTHPNIKTRRDKAYEILKNMRDTITGRKQFIVADRERFKRLRTIARFETARLYLLRRNYPEAIYTSYILQKEYPNSYYLKQITAKALYNLGVYRSPRFSNEPLDLGYKLADYATIEGNIQQVYFLFSQMSSDEVATTALSYCWKLKKEQPDDKFLHSMCENLIYLLTNHPMKPSCFKQREIGKKTEPEVIDTTVELSKYDKIRLQQKSRGINTVESRTETFEYAFSSLLYNDVEFKTLVDKYSEKGTLPAEWTSTEADESSNDSIIHALDPLLLKYQHKEALFGGKSSVKFNHKDFYQLQERYKSMLKDNAASARLSICFFDPAGFDSLDIELYNDLSILAEWFSENSNHSRALAINSLTDNLRPLEQKYGRYWMRSISVTERRKIRNLGGLITASVLFYPSAFIFVPGMVFHRRYEHRYYTQIIDLHKGKVILTKDETIRRNFKYSWISRRVKNTIQEFEEQKH